MNITSLIALFVPISVDQWVVDRIIYWRNLICEPGHPNFVFFESNLSNQMQTIRNHYLEQQSEPRAIFTKIYQYIVKVPFNSCPVLFLETDSTLRILRQASKHRKIIVCSAATYHHISPLFNKYELFDTIFLGFDQSQLVARYYNQFMRTHNRWTALARNPLIEAARDLAGAAFIIEINNELESMFAEFVLTEMNGTFQRRATPDQKNPTELMYTQLLTVFGKGHHLLFMNRMFEYRVLVPKLDDPKAIVSVLVDSFDAETWMVYGSMVLIVAFIRMFCARRLNIRKYLRSLLGVTAYIAFGSSMDFHRPLEQLVIGLSQLLNVILKAALASLVISLLLNPRFYPALDTLDLLNESCCWTRTPEMQSESFRHVGNCLPALWKDSYVSTGRDRERFECFMIHPYAGRQVNGTPLGSSVAAEYYRWSKVRWPRYPVMAVTFGGVGIAKQIENYAGAFFAEGALYRVFQPQEMQFDARGDHQLSRVIALEDLMLFWVIYCLGIGISTVVLVLENWYSGCMRRKGFQNIN